VTKVPRRILILKLKGRTNRRLKKWHKALHDLCSSLGVIAVIQAEEIQGSCSRHVGGEKYVKCAIGKSEEKRPPVKFRCGM
jgi:hypothetical protein